MAKGQGMETEVVLYPSGDINPTDLAQQTRKQYDPSLFTGIYIEASSMNQGYYGNCVYIEELARSLRLLYPNNKVGIHCNKLNWKSKMGGANNCTVFANLNLYYYDLDGKADFSDWENQQFGGWNMPYEKEYDPGKHFCG